MSDSRAEADFTRGWTVDTETQEQYEADYRKHFFETVDETMQERAELQKFFARLSRPRLRREPEVQDDIYLWPKFALCARCEKAIKGEDHIVLNPLPENEKMAGAFGQRYHNECWKYVTEHVREVQREIGEKLDSFRRKYEHGYYSQDEDKLKEGK